MSDTIEPTEAELEVLRWIMNWHVTQNQSLHILRAHVAAEVAKATGELLKDKERLDSGRILLRYHGIETLARGVNLRSAIDAAFPAPQPAQAVKI